MNNNPQYANDHPATLEEISGLDFEPYELSDVQRVLDRVQKPNSVCSFGERVAMVVCCKTKLELTSCLADGDVSGVNSIFKALDEAKQALRARLALVETAESRIFVAGAMLPDGNHE